MEMKTVLKICKKCGARPGSCAPDAKIHTGGGCGGELIDTGISTDELLVIHKISNDEEFLDAMIELKKKDIIEYNMKLSQFKAQTGQQNRSVQQSPNAVHCPRCGSTNIQVVPRKWSILTGYMTNKTDRVCVNCKHKF